MKEIKLENGFKCEVDECVMDNMELAEDCAELQETGNPVLLGKVLTTLLGADQRKRLYDHIRTEDGRVPVAAASNAFAELVKGFKEGKNS